jgi:hypothetical protein
LRLQPLEATEKYGEDDQASRWSKRDGSAIRAQPDDRYPTGYLPHGSVVYYRVKRQTYRIREMP